MESFFFLSGTLDQYAKCDPVLRHAIVDTCIIVFAKIHFTLSANQKRDIELSV